MISLKTVNKGVRRPINLFLAEIIIALLFFSISGAVILQVFAAADIKSRKSGELESVIICAQTLAEAYSESGNIVTAAKIVWEDPEINTTDGTNTEIYTADGKICLNASEQRKKTSAGELCELNMVFSSDGEELYALSCSAYLPDGGNAYE